jgi:predicted amidohydrolase
MNNNKKSLSVSLHQINTVTGDLFENTHLIMHKIKSDTDANVDISVFPETAITGYMCGSLWENLNFIKSQ